MPFYSYVLGILRFISVFLATNIFFCQASETPVLQVSHESMGQPYAPLGGIWVQDLEAVLKRVHFDMARRELELSKDKDTNVALFKLLVRLRDGSLLNLLEAKKSFLSGGFMLMDHQEQEVRSISDDRTMCREGLKAMEEKLKEKRQEVGRFPGKALSMENTRDAGTELTRLLDEVQQIEQAKKRKEREVEAIQVQEKQYEPLLFSENSKRYDGYVNAVYDPEQTIARIVDYYIQKMDMSSLFSAEKQPIAKENIDCFILSVHSRTDMCPFCLMFLADRVQAWTKKLSTIPFIAIVSSRQEYRCDYQFIKEKTYYRGYSMRSIGWRRARETDEGSSFDGLKKIAAEKLVIQYIFQPGEIYGFIETTQGARAAVF